MYAYVQLLRMTPMRKSLPCLLLWFTMCGLLAASSVWAAEPVGNVESVLVGKARFLVQDLQGYKEKRFRVQTQTAIVGTRDTDFVVGVVPEPPAGGICREPFVEAYCVENAIMMASRNQPDKPVILTSNMISQACGFEVPTPPRFATPAERARMTKGLEKIGSKTEIGPARPKAAASEKGEDKSGSGTTVGTGVGDSGGSGPGGPGASQYPGQCGQIHPCGGKNHRDGGHAKANGRK